MRTDRGERSLGNIFDLQTAEMAAATKKVIEGLSPAVAFYETVLDLINLRDPYKSTVFLFVTSFCLLHLELALGFTLLSILIFIQYNAYYHR